MPPSEEAREEDEGEGCAPNKFETKAAALDMRLREAANMPLAPWEDSPEGEEEEEETAVTPLPPGEDMLPGSVAAVTAAAADEDADAGGALLLLPP